MEEELFKMQLCGWNCVLIRTVCRNKVGMLNKLTMKQRYLHGGGMRGEWYTIDLVEQLMMLDYGRPQIPVLKTWPIW